MNSYERCVKTIRGEKVDFIPRIPILMHFAADYINSTYARYSKDYQALTETKIKLAKKFNFDQLDIMSDPWRETTAFGGRIEYLEDTVPKCTSHPLERSKDFSLLERPDFNSDRIGNALKAIDEFKRLAFKEYSITGWVEGPAAEAADLRGVTNFLIDVIDDPAYCGELMDMCVDFGSKFAREQIRRGCDTIGIGDAIASQVSAKIYEELIFPREQVLVKNIQEAGGFVRLHICGNINHLLPYIAKLRVDVLDCDWQVDMTEARKIIGSQTALGGNLDPVHEVMESSPEAIREKLVNLYKTVGNPFFVNAGCEIPRNTPEENLRVLCEPIPYN